MYIKSPIIKRLFLLLSLYLMVAVAMAQTNVSVATAELVDTFPYTVTNINTSGGGSASGMNGSCNTIGCCSTFVYRVETTMYGSLRVDNSNYTPLASTIIAYTPDIDNPQDWSDLTYWTATGNFCGFRDSLQLGYKYSWAGSQWMGTPDINDLNQVCPPGVYYMLLTNYNNQSGQGANSNFTFDFAPFCPDGYSCSSTSITLCDGDGYLSPSGYLYTTSGSYQDTLFGAAYGGLDSLIFTTLEIYHTDLVQDVLTDTADCKNSFLSYSANTEYAPYASFTETDGNWVDCNTVVSDLLNKDRSVFGWMKQASNPSSTQVLVGINTSGTGNICNLQISTSGYLGVYDGDQSQWTNDDVADGQWHYVGYTFNHTTGETKIYVDGDVEKTYTDTGQRIDSSTDRISLGQEFDGTSRGNFYEGLFTQVSMWSTVLTDGVINITMNSAIHSNHAKYGYLEAYYPMNIDCGADIMVVEDRSQNNNYGIASHTDIQSTTSLLEISGFNAGSLYTKSWKKDGLEMSTTSEFSMSGLASDAGNYQLTLNCDYFTTTDDWTVSIVDLPVISFQPVDTIAAVDENVVFETSITGGSYTYQWGEMVFNFAQKTTADGLGYNYAADVFVTGSMVYVATLGGLSISSNGGSGSFVNRTTTNGLGSNSTWGVSEEDGLLCVATQGGLSISTDNGTSFVNKTTTDGLGNLGIKGVHVSNGTIYAATYGGASISTDGGNNFVNKTTADGLGHDHTWAIYESNGTVYVATENGISISTDGGETYVNKTTANGLGDNFCRGVFAANGVIYVATNGGLSISTDSGENFVNKTTADGLGGNACWEVYLSEGVIYVAAQGGFSISNDGGVTFTNYTTVDGLITNLCSSVFASNNVRYVGVNGGLCISPLWDEISGETSTSMNLSPVMPQMDSTYYSVRVTSTSTGCSNFSDTVQLIIVNSWNGSVSTDWNTSGNWASDLVPSLPDTIIIRDVTNKPVISATGTASCNNLIINPGATLTIESNTTGTGSLIVEDKLFNNGTITAQRYTTSGVWHGISSPLSGNTANSYYLNGNPDVWLKEHDEADNAYTYLSSLTTPLTDMKGFFMWIEGSTPQTFEYQGELLIDEVGSDNNMVRSASGTENGWNFVGNPFTSAIDWDAASGWTKTNIDNTIYQYNAASSTWSTWNGTTGTNGGTQYIASGQGFFVSVTEGSSTGTLKMDDGVKVHNSAPFLKQTTLLSNFIRLKLSSGVFTDETVIHLNESASVGFDSDFDAYKLFSFNADVPQIYSSTGDYMAVNSLPLATSIIPVDVRGENNADMTIAMVENTGFDAVFLNDLLTGDQTNLINSNYHFTYEAGYSGRFTVSFTVVDVNEQGVDPIKIYAYNREINVAIPIGQTADVIIYNINGQPVSHSKGVWGMQHVSMNVKGYYVVRVISAATVTTKKVVIN